MNLKICVGTTCHLMGASTLIEFYENLDNETKKSIELEYATCFSACQGQYAPPVIKLNSQYFGNVTPESLRELLLNKLKDGE